MQQILSDVRFALRLLGRSPGFYAALIGILVAGIGATTAMFSVAESLLLRPLPYPDPQQLVMAWRSDPQVNHGPTSIPNFLDWKAQATSMSHLAAIQYDNFSLSSADSKPEALPGACVAGDFFPMLGVRPLQGRLFGPEDDRMGAPRVAVLSAPLWHRRFASRSSVIGSTIMLNSEPHTVIGIAPEGFVFAGANSDRSDVWTPLATSVRYEREHEQRGNNFLTVLGRRQPGVSLADAQAEMSAIAKRLEEAYPDSNVKKTVRLVDLHDELVGSSREGVWLLFAAVALVFVIVCANVASMLLTRAQARRGEVALRAALGATPSRLVRQILTETGVVFLLASVGGYLLSHALVGLFAAGLVDQPGARTIELRVDSIALLFCVAVGLGCGVLFGLVPALAVARVQPHALLKESGPRSGGTRTQKMVRGGLVVAEVALAFALLSGSGLALKAFIKVAETPPGFEPEGLATAKIVLPAAKYDDDARQSAFFRDLVAKLAAEPGVTAAAANTTLPMAGSNSNGSFMIEGRPEFPPGEEPNLERNVITPGYFRAMKTPVLRGREFTDADGADGRLVMVISQATADRFFPGEDPLGQRIDWGDMDLSEQGRVHRWREIVGVVGDVRRRGLEQPIAVESYVPLAQHPEYWMAVVARAERPEAVLAALPALVASLDPDQAVASTKLMKERVAATVAHQRYLVMLLSAFAGAALLLATLGIFGLVSYSTAQRTRELGIRLALGSTPRAVVGLVVKQGAGLVGAGLVLGFCCALLVGRFLASRFPGISAFDLGVHAGIPVVLGVAGVLACLLPAWRAVRIPPASALRYE